MVCSRDAGDHSFLPTQKITTIVLLLPLAIESLHIFIEGLINALIAKLNRDLRKLQYKNRVNSVSLYMYLYAIFNLNHKYHVCWTVYKVIYIMYDKWDVVHLTPNTTCSNCKTVLSAIWLKTLAGFLYRIK